MPISWKLLSQCFLIGWAVHSGELWCTCTSHRSSLVSNWACLLGPPLPGAQNPPPLLWALLWVWSRHRKNVPGGLSPGLLALPVWVFDWHLRELLTSSWSPQTYPPEGLPLHRHWCLSVDNLLLLILAWLSSLAGMVCDGLRQKPLPANTAALAPAPCHRHAQAPQTLPVGFSTGLLELCLLTFRWAKSIVPATHSQESSGSKKCINPPTL
jgi:hypothetical protein